MKKFFLIYIIIALSATSALAQRTLNQANNNANNQSGKKSVFIMNDVRNWRMVDLYTLADTIPVDTITNGFQINNPIWRENVANVTLGNLGSPYKSMFYLTQERVEGNIFANSLACYLESPKRMVYYDTKTPYTKFDYTMGYPKNRSEEFVQVLFTQSINSRLNFGAHYKYSTSIGRYDSQRADHILFKMFERYNGDRYSNNFYFSYNHSAIKENNGIVSDNYILYPDSFDYDNPDDVPVQVSNQKNEISTYQLFYNHSLVLAEQTKMDEDSGEYYVPIATAYHQIHMTKAHREYRVDDLSVLEEILDDLFPAVLNDPDQTKDSLEYFCLSNLFQLKLNEEFNTLMRFGLRAYIGNNIRRYHWPAQSTVTEDDDGYEVIHYHRNHESRVTSYVGGQIFKNQGDHFQWNAGAKFYFQGYNAGDFTADASLRMMFPLLGKQTELWAKGSINMRSPELWEERYMSNHYVWNKILDREKIVDIRGGIKIKDWNLELTAFSATENEKIYFNEEGLPDQKSGVTQIVGLYFAKPFVSPIGFTSIWRVALQNSSDEEVSPLPPLALYTTNLFQHRFFDVLTFQLGFDWRYNSEYYAPKYIPSTMQFAAQTERKVGNYHYFDPFINFQIKRVRCYLKYEHMNSNWGKTHYFSTIHYPHNPAMIKWGLSWNFYD